MLFFPPTLDTLEVPPVRQKHAIPPVTKKDTATQLRPSPTVERDFPDSKRSRGRQVVRQWALLLALEQTRERGLSMNELREVVTERCALRTLYRDLEQLQDAGFPLVNEDGRWKSIAQSHSRSMVPVTAAEVAALSLCEQLLDSSARGWLGQPLRSLQERLSALLTPTGRKFCEELRATAAATHVAPGEYAGHAEILTTLQDAVDKQHRLRLVHASPGKTASERLVDPYAMWLAGGRLYLIARCHRAQDFRNFAVARIEAAEVLDEAFDREVSFDLDSYVRRGFGVYGGPTQSVAVRLTREVAHLARERRFHHTQRVVELPDGAVTLTMDVAGLPEIAAWIAGFGGKASALAPAALVDAVKELHEGGLRAHAGKGKQRPSIRRAKV